MGLQGIEHEIAHEVRLQSIDMGVRNEMGPKGRGYAGSGKGARQPCAKFLFGF